MCTLCTLCTLVHLKTQYCHECTEVHVLFWCALLCTMCTLCTLCTKGHWIDKSAQKCTFCWHVHFCALYALCALCALFWKLLCTSVHMVMPRGAATISGCSFFLFWSWHGYRFAGVLSHLYLYSVSFGSSQTDGWLLRFAHFQISTLSTGPNLKTVHTSTRIAWTVHKISLQFWSVY